MQVSRYSLSLTPTHALANIVGVLLIPVLVGQMAANWVSVSDAFFRGPKTSS